MALEDARCAEKVDEPIESSQHNDFNFKEPKIDETKRRDDMWLEMLNFFKTWFFGISPHQLMLKIWCTLQEPFSSLPQKFSLPTTAFLIPNAPQAHGFSWWCQEMSWMTLEDFDRFNMSISRIFAVIIYHPNHLRVLDFFSHFNAF